jgi:hypothetical protein
MVQIIIRGHLDKNWADWFAGMEIADDGDNTILSGPLKDDSPLFGILNQKRYLNLKLLSVNPVDKKNHLNHEREKK